MKCRVPIFQLFCEPVEFHGDAAGKSGGVALRFGGCNLKQTALAAVVEKSPLGFIALVHRAGHDFDYGSLNFESDVSDHFLTSADKRGYDYGTVFNLLSEGGECVGQFLPFAVSAHFYRNDMEVGRQKDIADGLAGGASDGNMVPAGE